jgi:DNA repair exonuclease SbcCD ATPase subunit
MGILSNWSTNMSTSPKATAEDLDTLKTSIAELKSAMEEIKEKVDNLSDVLKTYDANVSKAKAEAEATKAEGEATKEEYQEKAANLSDNERNTLDWIMQRQQSQHKAKSLADAARLLPTIVKTLRRASSEKFSFGVIEGTDENPICLYFYMRESGRIAQISNTADGIKIEVRGQHAKDITDSIAKITDGIDITKLNKELEKLDVDPIECNKMNQKIFEHVTLA